MASSRNPSVTGRASLASDSTRTAATATTAQPRTARPRPHAVADSQYSISAVLAEPHASSSLLPSLPTLPSASSYLPSQLSSLSTTFTSAGTLPKAASGVKSVAQRRSQAPPIHVTDLRKVARAEFDAYLAEVSGDFERWQRESRLARDADGRDSAQSRRTLDGDDLDGDADARVGLGVREAGLAGSPALPPPVSSEVLPALDDVPQIFFDSSFDLANPRTFDLVTERIQLSPYPSPRLSHPATTAASSSSTSTALDSIPGLGPHTLNDLAADQVLQDKLSHYTAVIESHLVREIGLRSSSFFAALSNLQGLHAEGQAALAKITELQSALKASEGGVGASAQHGLQVLRAQARRRGLERIDEAVRAVEEVWVAVEGVKELVENGEWDGALEVSEQVEDAYYGSATPPSGASDASAPPSSRLPSSSSTSASSIAAKSTPSRASLRPLNLTKLRALSSLPTKLALLRAQIAKSLEGELTSVLEHEMDVGIDEHVRLARDGRRWKGKGKALEPPSAAASVGGGGARALHALPEESSSAAGDEGDHDAGPSPEVIARERTLERVRPVVSALVRAGGMDSAIVSWRESVLREVRALVREHLPTSETPMAEEEDHFAQAAVRSVSRGTSVDLGTISEKSVSLAKKLRALPHSAFLALARDTYAGLLACIEVVDLQARVLLELWSESRHEEQRRKARRRSGSAPAGQNGVARASDGESALLASHAPGATLAVPGSAAELAVSAAPLPPDSSRSSATDDASSLGTDITDVVHAVAELANVRFSKVIGVRTEVHAHLALADFVEIFDLSWSFVVACERVCQRMIVGLRGAMVSQAKTFVQTFHQRQITENARVVEEEQWAAAEVPPETQANIQLILDGATSDPTALLLGERRTARLAAESSTAHPRLDADVKAPAEAEPAKQIDIEGRQFFAVSAGLVTVAVLVEYLKVLANVPMLTTDAMSKIIEFMKVFNSRTCQVVLGAGAMRSAGLKNITAKHLALASQALSIMIALIPYIREAVRRHLNPKQAVMLTEFDKLKRDYQEHQHEIHAKLVAIMSDRLQVHSRSLEGINFEEPPPRGLDTPSAYMEALVKEHNTLHKVLSRFLATETVAAIMGQVFSALDERLGEVFAHVDPRSRSARDRMLVDVRYLRERLGELKGVEDNGPGKALEALVLAKTVPEAPAPPPAPPPEPVSTPTKPTARPPRTSSIPPRPDSPSTASTLAAPTPVPAPAPEPAPAVFSNARASTSSSSLSSATTTAPQPPSPVPVPAALPPSPKPASPAPYVSQKKKKSLAERLAESMGRRAAHAEPTSTAAHAEAASSAPVSATAAAPDAPRSSSDAAPSEPRAPPELSGELTPLALERAYENGIGVDTPSLEKALQLEGIELAAGGLATPAREELDEIEKAVEREIARVDGAGEDEVRALEAVAQEEEKAEQREGALGPSTEVRAQGERDDPVEAPSEPGQPVEATAPAAAPIVDVDVDAQPSEGDPLAVRDAAALEPAPAGEARAADDVLVEPVSVLPPVVVVEPVVVEEPVVVGEPLADALLSSTTDNPPLDDPARDLPSTAPRPLGADFADVSPSRTVDNASAVSCAEIEPGRPAADAEPVENGDAAAAAERADGAPALSAVDEPAPVEALNVDGDMLGKEGVQPATASTADAPNDASPPSAPTVEASVPQDDGVPATASVQVEPAPALALGPAPEPSSPVTSAPAPAAAALEPVPAPQPALPAAPQSSSTPSPAPAALDPAAPPRRKTLKERLAEAARRGSSGGSGSSLTSPPTSPSREVEPAPSPAVVLQSVGTGADEGLSVVTSPEPVASALPVVEPQPVVANGQQSGEENKANASEVEGTQDGTAGSVEVEEGESTFL